MYRLHILILCLCWFFISLPVFADNYGFCQESDDLTGHIENVVVVDSDSFGDVTQGLCVADEYLIVTHWRSASSNTIFFIYDIHSYTLVTSFSYNTGHSNSMCYNPEKKEVAVASSDGSGRVFLFRFEGGVMTYDRTCRFSHNVPGISYSSATGQYYLSTGRYVWATSDFVNYNRLFSIGKRGLTQGMGCDGNRIYICWSTPGKQYIVCYTLTGQMITTYTIDQSACREVEDLDFYQGAMYVGDNTVGPDTVHRVQPDHRFEFSKEIDATCEEEGQTIYTCSRCGTSTVEYTPALGHDWGKWSVVKKSTCTKHGVKDRVCKRCKKKEKAELEIDESVHHKGNPVRKEPTCLEDGWESVYCTWCHRTVTRKKLDKLNHDFQKQDVWQDSTVSNTGYVSYVCSHCGLCERRTLEEKEAFVECKSQVIMKSFSSDDLEINLQVGDYLKSCKSNRPFVVYFDGVKLRSFLPGKAKLVFKTASGVEKTVSVVVK